MLTVDRIELTEREKAWLECWRDFERRLLYGDPRAERPVGLLRYDEPADPIAKSEVATALGFSPDLLDLDGELAAHRDRLDELWRVVVLPFVETQCATREI